MYKQEISKLDVPHCPRVAPILFRRNMTADRIDVVTCHLCRISETVANGTWRSRGTCNFFALRLRASPTTRHLLPGAIVIKAITCEHFQRIALLGLLLMTKDIAALVVGPTKV